MKDVDLVAIGETIRRRRKQLYLTRQALADLPEVNMDAGYLGELERGTRHASIQTYYRLKLALGLNWDEMLGDRVYSNHHLIAESGGKYNAIAVQSLRAGIISELDRMDEKDLQLMREMARWIRRIHEEDEENDE